MIWGEARSLSRFGECGDRGGSITRIKWEIHMSFEPDEAKSYRMTHFNTFQFTFTSQWSSRNQIDCGRAVWLERVEDEKSSFDLWFLFDDFVFSWKAISVFHRDWTQIVFRSRKKPTSLKSCEIIRDDGNVHAWNQLESYFKLILAIHSNNIWMVDNKSFCKLIYKCGQFSARFLNINNFTPNSFNK
jgi:hypothetical protein